jgi:hypothetical protein
LSRYGDDRRYEVVVYARLPIGVINWLKRKFDAVEIEDDGLRRKARDYARHKDRQAKQQVDEFLDMISG